MEPVQNRDESEPDEAGQVSPKPASRTISELDAVEQKFKLLINAEVVALQPQIFGSSMTAIVKCSISLLISPELLKKISATAKDFGMTLSGALSMRYPLICMAIKDASIMKAKSLNFLLPSSWDRLIRKCLKAMIEEKVEVSENESSSSSDDYDNERPSKRRCDDQQLQEKYMSLEGASCSFVPIMQSDEAVIPAVSPAAADEGGAHAGGHDVGDQNADAQQEQVDEGEDTPDEATAPPATQGGGGRNRDRKNDYCGFPLT